MKIFLTIDVECYSGDYEREVWGNGLGLEFILTELQKAGLKATFFVEALGATRWGVAPTARICERIMRDGHEIGLHIHPVTARIEGFEDRFDTIWRQDRKTQAMLIRKGLDVLKDCGVCNIKSFRAGSLAANEDTLSAMADNGLFIGSNRDLDTKSSIESKLNRSFPVFNDLSVRNQVLDVPITCFRSPLPSLDGVYRHLEISATGIGEMRFTLRRMVKPGYRTACILTHPRELFRETGRVFRPVIKNVRRLKSLLAGSGIEADFRRISECREIEAADKTPCDIAGSIRYALIRLTEQVFDRVIR